MITNQMKKCLVVLLIFVMICGVFATVLMPTQTAAAEMTRGTGYDSADDVQYVAAENGKYILNWGYQGEKCVFLSDKAQDFYTGEYVYSDMSASAGITDLNDPAQSELYVELKTLMSENHTYLTTYDETRYQYKYTDCEKNDSSKIYLFYCGATYNSEWEKGYTWNREHVWPNSKCLTADTEKNDSADIMMLRPVHKSENSSRHNKAYGNTLTEEYFVPGETVKGDCARVLLYYATRWGNIDKMFGPAGVIEDLDTLLEWMEQDPVDTWEMGRNDAVQQITGTRNVFVDYPEYAWLLFGEEIPEGYQSPSDNDGVITLTDRKQETETDTGNTGPDIVGDKYKYTFASYPAGVTYGKNELHILDDNLKVTTDGAFFTTELRLYKNSTAIFEATSNISSMSINAGYKKDTVSVWASTDGVRWISIGQLNTEIAYADLDIPIPSDTYRFVRLDSTSSPVRIMSITVKYGAAVGGTGSETDTTETETVTETTTTETETETVTETITTETETTTTETETVTETITTETETETVTETITTETETETVTESITTETETVTETDTTDTTEGSTTEETDTTEISVDQSSSDSADVSDADDKTETHTKTDTETETETETKRRPSSTKRGCGSALGGGATLLISVSIAAFAVFTKKKKY